MRFIFSQSSLDEISIKMTKGGIKKQTKQNIILEAVKAKYMTGNYMTTFYRCNNNNIQ